MQIVSNTSGVKNVQRGTAYFSGNAAITVSISSVNMIKSFLVFSAGSSGSVSAGGLAVAGRISSATQIEFNRSDTTGSTRIDWEVIENV